MKRTSTQIADSEGSRPRKLSKTHPFFEKTKTQLTENVNSGSFQWLHPLGPSGTCLHGTNLTPKASNKVAAFDLDGTIIKSERNANSTTHWQWWRTRVPQKLQELYDSGYSIVLFSNQAIKPLALKAWKVKISLMGNALPTIPYRIFAATSKDNYRKPMIGMWNELELLYLKEGVAIEKTLSFFVGDAAGRLFSGGQSDFASTDRKWASNVGIAFSTPEEFFLNLAPHSKLSLPGFHVSSLPDLPLVTPTSSPVVPSPVVQEMVLFVGYPCVGKTSFYRRYFEPLYYIHVNQDTLKTRDKCIKAVKTALENGKSCVVDNTNRDIFTRKYYIELAQKHKIPVRCFLFTSTLDLAWHNNLYRTYNLPSSVAIREAKRELLPYNAFISFRDKYQEPRSIEGFSEIRSVNWVFHGTDEEKRYWSMWLQIDGK